MGRFPVFLAGQAVAPGGLEALMAGDLGHQYQVVSTAKQAHCVQHILLEFSGGKDSGFSAIWR